MQGTAATDLMAGEKRGEELSAFLKDLRYVDLENLATQYVDVSHKLRSKCSSVMAKLSNCEARRKVLEAKARSHESGQTLPKVAAFQIDAATDLAAQSVADLRVKLDRFLRVAARPGALGWDPPWVPVVPWPRAGSPHALEPAHYFWNKRSPPI